MLGTIQDYIYFRALLSNWCVSLWTHCKWRRTCTDVFIPPGSCYMSMSPIQVRLWRRVTAKSISLNGTVIILHSCPHWIGTDTAVLFRKLLMDKQRPQLRQHFGVVLLATQPGLFQFILILISIPWLIVFISFIFEFKLEKDRDWELWLKYKDSTVNERHL